MSDTEKDISDIKVTLDNLSYVVYKELKTIKKMLLMKYAEIEKIYPDIKNYEIEEPEEAVLPNKGKYKSACPFCGNLAPSTGIIILDDGKIKHEFICDKGHVHCYGIEDKIQV